MKLSVTHNFAFLCNPKCGSTSIEKAIAKHCRVSFGGHPTLKHINAKTYHKHIFPMLKKAGMADRIETFCIMREPVERVFSWYRYQMRPLLKDPSHPNHSKYTGNISFEQFVLGFLADKKPAYSAKIGHQADFITLADGSVGVDKIFRLSDMAGVEKYLTEKVGKEVKIPHRNVSPVEKPADAGKKGGLLGSLIGTGQSPSPAAATATEEPPKMKMDISDELLARLKAYLAEDYRIYDNHTVR